jgi:hypothetical protein
MAGRRWGATSPCTARPTRPLTCTSARSWPSWQVRGSRGGGGPGVAARAVCPGWCIGCLEAGVVPPHPPGSACSCQCVTSHVLPPPMDVPQWVPPNLRSRRPRRRRCRCPRRPCRRPPPRAAPWPSRSARPPPSWACRWSCRGRGCRRWTASCRTASWRRRPPPGRATTTCGACRAWPSPCWTRWTRRPARLTRRWRPAAGTAARGACARLATPRRGWRRSWGWTWRRGRPPTPPSSSRRLAGRVAACRGS